MKYARALFFVLFIFIISAQARTANAITVDISATVLGCGDEIISFSEQCDGTNLGGATCASLGYSAGTLSCSFACTYITSACTTESSGSSGGGSGGGSRSSVAIPFTNVVFSGLATPKSRIHILKDGQMAATVIVQNNGAFTATLSGLSNGKYQFTLYGVELNGLRSTSKTFSVTIKAGVTTKVGDIVIPKATSEQSGNALVGDVNGDTRVNLVDFSIVAYWYLRATPPSITDLNKDGKITLVDFSILAFHWTG